MMNATVTFPAGSLSSRKAASAYRYQILEAIKNSGNTAVYIDLSKVENISGSFADEAIGVLVKQIGYEELIKKIRLRNGDTYVNERIAEAIIERKREVELLASA